MLHEFYLRANPDIGDFERHDVPFVALPRNA